MWWWLYAFVAIILVYVMQLWYKHVRDTIMLKDMPGYPLSYIPFVSSITNLMELSKSDKGLTTGRW